MPISNLNYVDTDSADPSINFYNDSDTLPDFSALNAAFAKFGKRVNNFFAIQNHPKIPFYDTPHSAIFSGSSHKKMQIKQRILEYRAKY